MNTPFAWRNFTQAGPRAIAMVCGVGLAILLIFMQLGFRAAAVASATSIHDSFDFDILIVSRDYLFIVQPGSFGRDHLEAIRAEAAVETVTPVRVGLGEWRNVQTRERWNALVLGIDPGSAPFRDARLNAQLDRLTYPDTALVDRQIRPELEPMRPGDQSELEDRRIRLVGDYVIGAGFTAGATMIVDRETFLRLFPSRASMAQVNLGLLRLRPEADPEQVAALINRRLAPEARALTRRAIQKRERRFWLSVKPIGIMFSSGVAIAFVAGAAILYQVLAGEVQRRLSEYATLRALGYGDRAILALVVQQGQLFALLGFVPAALLANGLYWLLTEMARVPVAMTWQRAAGVLLLTIIMGVFAAMIAAHKLRRADPAELF